METPKNINHGEMYEDLMPQASSKSQYSLSTRIEARIRYAFYRLNPIENFRRSIKNIRISLSLTEEDDLEKPRTLDSFFQQVEEEKEAKD